MSHVVVNLRGVCGMFAVCFGPTPRVLTRSHIAGYRACGTLRGVFTTYACAHARARACVWGVIVDLPPQPTAGLSIYFLSDYMIAGYRCGVLADFVVKPTANTPQTYRKSTRRAS